MVGSIFLVLALVVPHNILIFNLAIRGFLTLEGDLIFTELVGFTVVSLGNRLISGLVRHRDVDVLRPDLLSDPSVKFISLAVLVRDSVHDAADVVKQISKLLSCIRDVFSVTSGGLLFVKLVKALELTPLNVIVKMEVVELVSELLDLLVESNGFSADDKKFVLELSEFFNKLLKLVS